MSAVAAPPRPAAAVRPEARRPEGARSRTLGQKLDSVWEGLRVDGAVECPVCAGPMEVRREAGHCLRCGSTLS